MYIADLHIHSRFSRATSKDCDLPHLDWWARRKGIGLIGTGDFTHPAWRAELAEQLVPAGDGVYTLRQDLVLPGAAPGTAPRFVITGEISCIYKRHGKTRKVHNLILLPSLEAAEELSARLEAIGNIHSDGRPILGLDSRDLLELTLETCPEAEFIPAHIWTPHFSLFGAFSGFDTMEDCFGDLTPHIHAVETGLSSDPPMNWRVSALDHLTLVSHSDAHSPSKLGREADLVDVECTYSGLTSAIRTGEGFLGTVEFFPEEGKYHLDGHRSCGVCLTPAETVAHHGRCPVCGKPLTIGVEHRVEELADRPMGYRPSNAKPFESLAPLPEVIAASTGGSASGKKTLALYEQMLQSFGSEFTILRSVPPEDIAHVAGPCVAEGIRRLRQGQVERRPGFDGEYGTISLLTPAEISRFSGQISLFGIESAAKKAHSKRELQRTCREAAPTPAASPTESLNPRQQAAVSAREQTIAVVAGPGTGKTSTLVARIAYLVEELGVKPGEITAVTFTRQAAVQMRRRLEERLGGKRAVAPMTIGTFHAICWELLGKPCLVTPGQARELAEQILSTKQDKTLSPDRLLQAVSRIKNGAVPEEAGISQELYETCCAQLKARNLWDFDDLIAGALKMGPTGRRAFRHLLVDEFQDINDLQYQLIRLWSQGGQSLFVIGDPHQSIYGFRGSRSDCFRRLTHEIPHTREIYLEENYRSTPQILSAACRVIDENPGGPRILHPRCPDGMAVRLVQAPDEFAESIFIAREISRMSGGVDMLEAQSMERDRPARAFSDIAVLCRTHRQLELVEKCLRHDDIPCLVHGRESFLDAPEVQGLLAFLHTLQVPGDSAALETALRLLWDCPRDLIQIAQQACERQTTLDLDALRQTATGYGPLEAWLKQAEEWLPLAGHEKPWKLVERWKKQYGATPALDRLQNTAVFHASWQDFWNALTLGQEADLCRAAGRETASGAVRLMTLHAAKGLEFPAVILAGLKAGTLPLESPGRTADLEEERRLLYVGMTRAREELILTVGGSPSSFLSSLPEEVLRESAPQRSRPAQQLSLF